MDWPNFKTGMHGAAVAKTLADARRFDHEHQLLIWYFFVNGWKEGRKGWGNSYSWSIT